MSYIELLNEFWNQDRFNPFENVDTKLYLLLLDESNIRKWINPIVLHTYYLEERLRIKRKAIGEARNRLKQRGVIDFIAKTNNPTIFLLTGVEITNKELIKLFPQRNNKETIGKQLGNNKETIGKHNNKDYIDYKDNKTERAPSPNSLFNDEELNGKKKKIRKESGFSPPALDEVLEYFSCQDAANRIENWEESARRFYDYFNAVDWKDKNGRLITRWDSRANNWILDDEQRQKTNQRKEDISKGSSSDTPSGGIPIRGKVTPSCGLKRRDPSGET